MKNQKEDRRLKSYFIILLIMTIAAGIFLNSFYWPYQEISKRKIVVLMIAAFFVVIVPILIVKTNWVYAYYKKIAQSLKCFFQKVIKNKKTVVVYTVGCAVGLILAYILVRVLSICNQTSYNQKMFCFFVALEGLLILSAYVKKKAFIHCEHIFVIVALIMGLFCICVTPKRVGVSWDDEIHYARTLELSDALNGIRYFSDQKNIDEYGHNIYDKNGFDRESDMVYQAELETSYSKKDLHPHLFENYGIWSISYIPGAVGIVLARGLDLSYSQVFDMGRCCNLFCYILLIYCAIKRIKHGKVLVATIGLIPTNIFMAASYSYDWWVTGFTVLGFSYFFAELQTEAPLRLKNMIIMIGTIALGCMPKAIYFPILFPLLFMPKKKFQSSKQRNWYHCFIVISGLLLVASFILPMLIEGPGTGDIRGGSDVNSAEQIKYILQNPFEFAKTLLGFLRYYISVDSMGPMLQRFAYVGEGGFYGIIYIMLPVLAFLDLGNTKSNTLVRGTCMLGCVAALVLSTTALYISFTAVGSQTVAGMQGRYIIPLILPSLYAIGAGGVRHKMNQKLFVCLPMFITALTFIYNMFCFCVITY